MKIVKKIKGFFITLVELNNTPHEIALGVAVGVFIGITPLYGFHTILAVLAALLIPRTHKIAIIIGSNISLPITAPFISWTGYQIGRFLLNKNFPDIRLSTLKHFSYKEIGDILYPLFLGSFILGIIGAFVFYFIILFAIKKKRGRTKSE
jgi:hypothetical protein